MFDNLDVKNQNDFLGALMDVMNRQNLSGRVNSDASQPNQINGAFIEALGIVSKAQLALKEKEMELEAVVANKNGIEQQLSKLREDLSVAVNSVKALETEKITLVQRGTDLDEKLKVANTESEKVKTDLSNELEKIKTELESLKSEIETLKSEKANLETELQTTKEELGKARVQPQAPKGQVQASVAELSTEQAAESISETEDEKLIKEYEKLETLSRQKGGSYVREFSEFCRKHYKELGIPLA